MKQLFSPKITQLAKEIKRKPLFSPMSIKKDAESPEAL